VSAYADDETIELLRTRFVSVGISLQEELKAQDPAGEFFRKITNQRPEPAHTKQGFYIASPDGSLLRGWMYPRPDTNGTVKKNLKEAAAAYQPPSDVEPISAGKPDRNYKGEPPAGATVIETRTKMLQAEWPAPGVDRFDVVRQSMGHDRLWVLKPEVEALAKGAMPDSLLQRIVRFHLGDNTRCYLDKWAPDAMREVTVNLKRDGGRLVLDGTVILEQGDRGFDAKLYGILEVRDGALVRFDVAARGQGWGKHNGIPYAPVGKFTVANAFTLARPGVTFDVLPVWNWVPDYLQTANLRVSEARRK
jgi:hypothetical protein